MPTNQQRRDAERRRLQKQLEDRRAREAARKRATLITSIVGTVVLIAAVVIVVVLTAGGSDKKSPSAAGSRTTTPSTSLSSTAAPLAPPDACAKAPKGSTVTFDGVTVGNATDLSKAPTVKSLSEQAPNKLECMDLVVGKGKPARPGASVTAQYTGALYKNGTVFDSSWQNGGQPVPFTLKSGPGGVIDGFNQGIGGIGKVAPMRAGGRRIMILPAALAYGATASASIPANSPLVFVVDLKRVSG